MPNGITEHEISRQRTNGVGRILAASEQKLAGAGARTTDTLIDRSDRQRSVV